MAKSDKPRISVNKLGEYIEANPTRRKQIVKDCKYPSNFIQTRYSDAREALKKYILNGLNDDIINDTIKAIGDKPNDTDFQENDNSCSIAMLEKVLDSDLSILDGYTFRAFSETNKLVEISGVDISVYPDLVLTKTVGVTENIGVLKFNVGKTVELSEESSKVIAAMLYKYTEDYIAIGTQLPNLKMCLSFDVFNGTFESSPKAYALRMKRVESACEEIALWWDKL